MYKNETGRTTSTLANTTHKMYSRSHTLLSAVIGNPLAVGNSNVNVSAAFYGGMSSSWVSSSISITSLSDGSIGEIERILVAVSGTQHKNLLINPLSSTTGISGGINNCFAICPSVAFSLLDCLLSTRIGPLRRSSPCIRIYSLICTRIFRQEMNISMRPHRDDQTATLPLLSISPLV